MANTTMQNLLRLPSTSRELDDLIKKIVGESESRTLADAGAREATVTTEVPLFVQAAQARAPEGMTADQVLEEYSARLRQSTYPTLDCLLPEDVQRVAEGSELSAPQLEHVRTCEPCTHLLSAAQPSAERRAALLEELQRSKNER